MTSAVYRRRKALHQTNKTKLKIYFVKLIIDLSKQNREVNGNPASILNNAGSIQAPGVPYQVSSSSDVLFQRKKTLKGFLCMYLVAIYPPKTGVRNDESSL